MVDSAFAVGTMFGMLTSFFTNLYDRNRMFHHTQRTFRYMFVGGVSLSFFNFLYRSILEKHLYQISYMHMMMEYGRHMKEYGTVQDQNQDKIKRFLSYTQIDME